MARHLALRLVSFTRGGQPPPHGAHRLFLTNRTLTGSRASVLRRAIGHRHRRNPARGPITAFLASIGNRRLFGVAPLLTPHQVFLTDHTLTGSRIFCLLNSTMVGLIADMFLFSQCVLTVRRFRTTSAHCDDRRHCAQQRASRTCPTAAPVWRLGCSCIFFTASN